MISSETELVPILYLKPRPNMSASACLLRLHICVRGELKQALGGERFDSATHVGVCDNGKLVGVLRIEDLLSAEADTAVSQIMDGDPPVVTHGVDQEKAAWKAVQHGESALAVVDSTGRFIGFIPPDRLLAVLLHEHKSGIVLQTATLTVAAALVTCSFATPGMGFLHQ